MALLCPGTKCIDHVTSCCAIELHIVRDVGQNSLGMLQFTKNLSSTLENARRARFESLLLSRTNIILSDMQHSTKKWQKICYFDKFC